jgi:hypothetical protein
LTLPHAHTEIHGDVDAATPGALCSGGCARLPLLCSATCSNIHENPVIDSLMDFSYSNGGQRPRAAGAPGPTDPAFAGCTPDGAHFSKGFNSAVNEAAVDDFVTAVGGQYWQRRSLVRTVACFNGQQAIALPTASTPAMCSAPLADTANEFAFPAVGMATPWCNDAVEICVANWDCSPDGPQSGTYAAELSVKL